MRLPLSGIFLVPLLTTPPLWSAPSANPDTFTALENRTITIEAADGVLKNDNGSDPLSAVLESDVSNGSLTLNADGSFTYSPAPNFNGTDTFTYRTRESPTGPQAFTIDQSQSSATINATVTNSTIGSDDDSTSSRLDGTVAASVTPSTAPFSEIQITDFNIGIAENVELSFRFLGGFAGVKVKADAGDISIEMVQPGAPSAVGADGEFDQPQNEVRAFGTVEATGTGLAAGQVPSGEQNFDDDGFFLDLAGTITQSGNNPDAHGAIRFRRRLRPRRRQPDRPQPRRQPRRHLARPPRRNLRTGDGFDHGSRQQRSTFAA